MPQSLVARLSQIDHYYNKNFHFPWESLNTSQAPARHHFHHYHFHPRHYDHGHSFHHKGCLSLRVTTTWLMSSLSTSVIWELTMCNVGTATIRPSRLWEYSMLCNCFTTCLLPWKDVLWREELPKLEHLAFKTRFKIYKLTLLINQDIFIIATENFKDSFKFSRPSLQVNNNDESALTHEKQ